MNTFLEQVARDILLKAEPEWNTSLDRLVIVFPNKRAALYLDDHLANMAQRPLWSPRYYSISELFSSLSHLQTADPLLAVSRLWQVYTGVTGIDETLDEFFGWGQMLLADFNDIDNQMADADRIFANLQDLHELDDMSFLTQGQIDALRQFFTNLSQDPVSQLRQRFLHVWSRLAEVYHAFRNSLQSEGLAYEGMLCRDVVEQQTLNDDGLHYLFVGFNVLSGVERQLFKMLKQQGRAHFYWDYDDYYMPQRQRRPGYEPHEAGFFVAQHLQEFPNELSPELFNNFRQPKDITVISAQTEDIQGRYVGQWLKQQPGRIADGRRTAIVMCNEQLLTTVLHQLPEELQSVNVTTGYPLSYTPVASLLQSLADLRTTGYRGGNSKKPEYRYRMRWLNAVLHHPYIMPLADGEDMRQLLLTFDDNQSPTQMTLDTARWMTSVLRMVGTEENMQRMHSDFSILNAEAIFRAYTLMQRLVALMEQGQMPIDMPTLSRLIRQLMSTTTIPFHGEPAEGLQVMGMLETRCLDFSHVLLLSAGEGQLPRGVNDQSFIPYALRKAHGLTTPDHRVAIYSYYFNRLLQRAEDITICYNAATNDTAKGEMSRFVMQLLVEDRHHSPQLLSLQPALGFTTFNPAPHEKTADVMERMQQRFSQLLSPTALGRYMRCPLIFYFNYVEGISEPDDDDDEGAMDQMDFGNVFHEAARIMYSQLAAHQGSNLNKPATGSGLLTKQMLEKMMRDTSLTERIVDQAFDEVMQHRHGQYSGLQLISREVIIQLLRRLLRLDMSMAPLNIIGVEVDVKRQLHIEVGEMQLDTVIGGRIDRLDMVTTTDGQRRIRVVDYKTGAAKQPALPDVEAIFDTEQLKNHNDYYLQTMLYADILACPPEPTQMSKTPVVPALLYIQHAGTEGYDPVLTLGRVPIDDVKPLHNTFNEHLEQLVNEIFDADKPFSPTPHTERCQGCPYRVLCNDTH